MFPPGLTYGVFDEAIFQRTVPSPILCVQAVSGKPEKLYFNAVDGGSKLDDHTKFRSTLRCMVQSPSGDQIVQAGDIISVSHYDVKIIDTGEPFLFIKTLTRVGRAEQPIQENATGAYKCNGAKEALNNMRVKTTSRYNTPQQQQLPTANSVESHVWNQKRMQSSAMQSSAIRPNNPSRPFLPDSPFDDPSSYPTSNHPPESGSLYPSLPKQPPMTNQSRGSRNPYISGPPSASEATEVGGATGLAGSATFPSGDGDSYRPVRRAQQAAGPQTMNNGTSHPARAAPYPPQFKPTGPVAHRTDGQFVPIRTLSAFLGRWIVKGRFINKAEPRTYTNQRGEGKIWNIDLMDSADEGGTIRCTFFNKAIDKFYDMIKENQIYTVTKGSIKTANKKFNSGAHDFELHLGDDAEIHWCAFDDPGIPTKHVPKVKDKLTSEKEMRVDITWAISLRADVAEIITRNTGQPRSKREITIVDSSETCVDLTLWGNKIQAVGHIGPSDFPAVLVQNARVDEYNGRKLSSVGLTTLTVNPPSDEAKRVLKWFSTEGHSMMGRFQALTQASWSDQRGDTTRRTISEIKEAATRIPETELEDKGLWSSCRATLARINRDRQYYWLACPTCQRKVTYPGGNDGFGTGEVEVAFCGTCQKEVEQPVRRYILQVDIADAGSSGVLTCQAMGDRGTMLMGGLSADDLVALTERVADWMSIYKSANDCFIDRLSRVYIFKIQAKAERYRDETTVKYRIFGIEGISGSPNDAQAVPTMRSAIVREGKSILDWIYERIPRVVRK